MLPKTGLVVDVLLREIHLRPSHLVLQLLPVGFGLVVQRLASQTFVTLIDHLGDFRYDPEKRFRGWLATVALRKAWRHLERRDREAAVRGGTTHQALVEELPGRDANEQTERLERVLDQVRAEVSPLEWDVFQLTVLQDLDPQAAAQRLHIELGYLYVCRSRVKRMLQRILEQGDE
jgi:RNA polymerase sigma factor (sigma-70 family)